MNAFYTSMSGMANELLDLEEFGQETITLQKITKTQANSWDVPTEHVEEINIQAVAFGAARFVGKEVGGSTIKTTDRIVLTNYSDIKILDRIKLHDGSWSILGVEPIPAGTTIPAINRLFIRN